MATALIPYVQIVPDERLMRIPDIRADLLPVEVAEARRARKVRTVVIAVVVVFAALLFGWYGIAHHQVGLAQNGLNTAQDDVRSLTRQQADFKQLVTTQSQIKVLSAQLTGLLSNDLQWSALLASLVNAEPAGVTLTSVSGALNSLGAGGSAADATQLPSAVVYTQIGTLQLVGSAPNKRVVAAYVDALGKVPGVASPLLSGANEDNNQVTFTIGMDITKSALGGRFATASPSASGK
jgi:Tfp pilus assembly protein PilN